MENRSSDLREVDSIQRDQSTKSQQPFQEKEEAAGKEEQKKKRNKRLIIIGIILIIVAILLALLTYCSDKWYDDGATYVSFAGMSDEEINDELNRRVEEGMMNIQIASTIAFEDGSSEGAARIRNAEANQRDMKVVITLNSTEEVVYESGAMAPGQGIEKIRLNTVLSEGTYEATAMFTGYNLETHKEMGSAGASVKLEVLS